MYKKKTAKKIVINTKNMGINIDKNEFREIVLSNTNRPEASFAQNAEYIRRKGLNSEAKI